MTAGPSTAVPRPTRRRRRRLGAAVVLAVSAAAATPAVASADVQDLGPFGVGAPAVTADSQGNIIAGSYDLNAVRLYHRPAGGTVTSVATAPGDPDKPTLGTPDLTFLGGGSGFAVWSGNAGGMNPATALGSAAVSPTAGWSLAASPLPAGFAADRPAASADNPIFVPGADGTLVAVWKRIVEPSTYPGEIVTATRSADGVWGPTTTIATDVEVLVDVLHSRSGQIIPVWKQRLGSFSTGTKGWRIGARRRLPDGTWQAAKEYTGAQGYGPSHQSLSGVEAGVDGYDNVTIAYGSSTREEAGQYSPRDDFSDVVDVATLKPGHDWSAPKRLSTSKVAPGTYGTFGNSLEAVNVTSVTGTEYGNTVVTWVDRETNTVRMAMSDSEQSWGPETVLDQAPKGEAVFSAVDTVENPAQVTVTVTWKESPTLDEPGTIHARDVYTWDGSTSQRFDVPIRDGVPGDLGNPVAARGTPDEGMRPVVTDRGDTIVPYGGSGFTSPFGVVVDDVGGPALSAVAGPSSLGVGTAGGFSVTATDAFSSLGTITWDFGDGTSATGASVSHAWATAGTYPVSLTATDEHGNRSATSTVVTVGGAAARASSRSLGGTGLAPASTRGRAARGTVRVSGVRVAKGRLSLTASGPAALNVAIQRVRTTTVRTGGKRRSAKRYTPLTTLQVDPGVAGPVTVRVPQVRGRKGYRVIVARRGTEGRPVRRVTVDR